METKEDGEDVLLESCELRSRKDFVGYNTTDEGLEDSNSEKGAIAEYVVGLVVRNGRQRE